jgi:hypothetical protein
MQRTPDLDAAGPRNFLAELNLDFWSFLGHFPGLFEPPKKKGGGIPPYNNTS